MAADLKGETKRPTVMEDDSSQPTPSSSDSTAFESYADGEFNRRLLAKAAMAAESKQENMRPPDNVDSQPIPFDSTNCGDDGSKKIAAAAQPPTLNAIKKIDDGNDADAALRPFNSSELEDESKPKIALGNESTNEDEGQRDSLRDSKIFEASQRSISESQKSAASFVYGNETVGATPFSRESQKSEANASVSPIIEAYLVEDEGGSGGVSWPRYSVYEATPLEPEIPWWKQRRTKVFMVINCILITALAVGLGVTFSRSQQLRGDSDAPTADDTTAAPTQGWFHIKSKLDERFCIDAMHIDDMSAVGDGQQVYIQPCDSNKWSQQWMWDREGRLRWRHGDEQYCMEAGSSGGGGLGDKMFVSKCDDESQHKWSILNDGRIQNNIYRMYIGSEGCYIQKQADECRAVQLSYYEEDGNCALSQTWTLSAAQSQEQTPSIPSPSPRFICNLEPTSTSKPSSSPSVSSSVSPSVSPSVTPSASSSAAPSSSPSSMASSSPSSQPTMVDPTLMPTPRAFCGCAACTQEVWDTIATDAGGSFTCGDRISWLTTEKGMNEYEACEKVSMEFPEGPCGPVCDPFRCSNCGCVSCTQKVWDTIATDYAGNFTCGDRISWLTNEQGMSGYEACVKVSSEFPSGPCGPACDPNLC